MSKPVTDSTPVVIAHVNVARGYRGGERQTELLIRALAGWGVRQMLIARRDGALARRLSDLDLDARPISGGPLSVARAAAGASLVHVHEGRSVYGAYLRWLCAKTPYVVTRRVNNPIGNHWLAHRAYRAAAAVAAVAPQIAAGVKIYDAAVRVEVIHSGSSALGVDEARAAEIRAAHRGKLLVGHVGALDNAQKGQEYILAVARGVERSHPELHFVLVGGGDDEVMLKTAANGLTNVTFTGFVDNVGDYLAAFDLFVLPSNREGIGSILFDAMDRRLPIIASSVGGVPDIVREDENGLLIEAGRTDQLRAAILALAAAPERRRRLGERGHEIAKAFTADIMARKYLALYSSVLERDP
jgi:glycosyltransferase involved in cell wall biosynthesis